MARASLFGGALLILSAGAVAHASNDSFALDGNSVAKFAASAPDRPDPALWAHMLDLIYAGNAAAARRFFDLAWPPHRPGKAAFLADFTRQLRSGELWRRYRLGRLLRADAIFR